MDAASLLGDESSRGCVWGAAHCRARQSHRSSATGLRLLSFVSVSQSTHDVVPRLLQLTALRGIDLRQCASFADEHLEQLCAALPLLEVRSASPRVGVASLTARVAAWAVHGIVHSKDPARSQHWQASTHASSSDALTGLTEISRSEPALRCVLKEGRVS